jgi:acyl carrier protein
VQAITDIESQLIQELATILNVEPKTITPDTPLATLGVDSMSLVEMLVFIEKRFQLRLIESGLTRENLATLRALAACIHAKCSAS